MNYKIEVLPNEPIMLYTMLEQFSMAQDGPQAQDEAREILEQSSQPMFMILDVTGRSVTLDDVVHGASQSARGKQPILQHPKVRKVILVATSSIVKIATKGLNTATFGNVDISVFGTVDEALTYVRSQIDG